MASRVGSPVQSRDDAHRAFTSDDRPMFIRATLEDTAGRLQVVEMFEKPRTRAPLHVHEYAEAWYIVDGTYGFYCDGVWRRAAAGSFVYASPGVPHAIAALPGSGCHKISLMLNPDSADNATKFAMDLQGMIDVPCARFWAARSMPKGKLSPRRFAPPLPDRWWEPNISSISTSKWMRRS